MIKRYSDHAANERTFLAWVRTAIAVMAFGFVIERFDLFLKIMPRRRWRSGRSAPTAKRSPTRRAWPSSHRRRDDRARRRSVSAKRQRTSKSEEDVPSPGERFDLALALLIALLGVAMFLYLPRAVLPAI